MCSLIERAIKKEIKTVGREEIKKMMKLCVPCWSAVVFCLRGSLELGVFIEVNRILWNLVITMFILNKWENKERIRL